jgi:hypothetical protein
VRPAARFRRLGPQLAEGGIEAGEVQPDRQEPYDRALKQKTGFARPLRAYGPFRRP